MSRGRRALALCAALSAALTVVALVLLQSGVGTAGGDRSVSNASQTQGVSGLNGVAVPGTQPSSAARSSGGTSTAEQSSTKAAVTVHIKNYAFSPASLSIRPGDKVTWINDDSVEHTVTSDSGPHSFDSGLLAKGQSFSYTFDMAGTYTYHCSPHPDMKGKVTVSGSGSGSGGGGGGGSGGGSAGGDTGQCTPNLIVATATPFVQHMYSAHLERGPFDQAGDALNVNQYVKTHTVLVEHIINPAIVAAGATLTGVNPFTQHFYTAHLERAPFDQVADLLNANQYTKTHTVLVEDMTKPGTYAVAGTC
jgi:amicyanin